MYFFFASSTAQYNFVRINYTNKPNKVLTMCAKPTTNVCDDPDDLLFTIFFGLRWIIVSLWVFSSALFVLAISYVVAYDIHVKISKSFESFEYSIQQMLVINKFEMFRLKPVVLSIRCRLFQDSFLFFSSSFIFINQSDYFWFIPLVLSISFLIGAVTV